MATQQKRTVVFTTDCVEKCGVLPEIRRDEDGNVHAFLPRAHATSPDDGQWVAVNVTQTDNTVTLACEPGDDNLAVVYVAKLQRYHEALAGKRHRAAICGVPHTCGPCDDQLGNTTATLHRTDKTLDIHTDNGIYHFAHDATYSDTIITPEMITIVLNYITQQHHTTPDITNVEEQTHISQSFFDVLAHALSSTANTPAFTKHNQ